MSGHCKNCGHDSCECVLDEYGKLQRPSSFAAPAGSASDFLTAEQIPIGSWWEIAQGGNYGYVVTAVNLKTKEATVLSTEGEIRTIDTFKLQYRYSRVLPNAAHERPANNPKE